ncbi:hypothetical protein [Janthinobacterium sp. B9-8]|uniref:hypothetical protein n=1 Tax=Janthinobacterium sp. B9-8 TaxID=1236179 RepID=UPI00061D29F4|nr:hypothetical protein [Janthinobacterium sp. B9-8]AMC36584.1 hypothetical protein VN23_19310 [Janthinobacterium sp. B9-8]
MFSQLNHNDCITNKTMKEVLADAISNTEIILAMSFAFDDDSYDPDTAESYENFHLACINEVAKELGAAVYSGNYDPDDEEFANWLARVCPNKCTDYGGSHWTDQLSVWQKDSSLFYIRYSWCDRDAPIEILFGSTETTE